VDSSVDDARVAVAIRGRRAGCGAVHDGQRGHPVGFSAACYAMLAALTGDKGSKAVVAAHADSLARIEVDDAGILRDVDTLADLKQGK
jgi:molybdenum cofactor cytidylyltransferase